jgi:uncharacterized protein DUF5343
LAKDLPYLPTYKNVGILFDRIEKAKIPDAFTVKFLTDTIGLKGSGDRQLITLLKKLGFLDNAGRPTPEYSHLKNKTTAKGAIAKSIRKAYAPLFEANEDAHNLPNDQLKGMVAQVSGAEEAMTRAITYTFNALVKAADFTKAEPIEADENKNGINNTDAKDVTVKEEPPEKIASMSKFNPDFRFNIEIHLPSNGTEETYMAIFNALRRSLG